MYGALADSEFFCRSPHGGFMFKDVGSQLHSPFFYDALHGKRLPNSRLSHLYAEKAGEYATERIENGPRLSVGAASLVLVLRRIGIIRGTGIPAPQTAADRRSRLRSCRGAAPPPRGRAAGRGWLRARSCTRQEAFRRSGCARRRRRGRRPGAAGGSGRRR